LEISLDQRILEKAHQSRAAIALHYVHYNFIRRHKALGATPAVAAGIADREWTVEDLVQILEDEERKVANGGRIRRADQSG